MSNHRKANLNNLRHEIWNRMIKNYLKKKKTDQIGGVEWEREREVGQLLLVGDFVKLSELRE
jgi:hypothetical protein